MTFVQIYIRLHPYGTSRLVNCPTPTGQFNIYSTKAIVPFLARDVIKALKDIDKQKIDNVTCVKVVGPFGCATNQRVFMRRGYI